MAWRVSRIAGLDKTLQQSILKTPAPSTVAEGAVHQLALSAYQVPTRGYQNSTRRLLKMFPEQSKVRLKLPDTSFTGDQLIAPAGWAPLAHKICPIAVALPVAVHCAPA